MLNNAETYKLSFDTCQLAEAPIIPKFTALKKRNFLLNRKEDVLLK